MEKSASPNFGEMAKSAQINFGEMEKHPVCEANNKRLAPEDTDNPLTHLQKKVKRHLHFAAKCIIFVIAKREPTRGVPLFCIFTKEKMGFLGRFLVKRKIFLGLYEENFGKSYANFLHTKEKFCAATAFFPHICAYGSLKLS